MKYLRQIGILLAVTLAAELFKALLPLPIPASVYGLLFMLLLLKTGIVKLSQVEQTGNLLIELMPLLFVPAGVGLLTSFPLLKGMLVPLLVIVPVTTVIVMAVTGLTVQGILRRGKGKRGDE